METKRRNLIVETLNEKYAFLINNFNVKEAYSKIVTWKPYKALSCFVYDWSFTPLKRREVQEALRGETKKLIKNNAATNGSGLSEEEQQEFSEKSHRAYIVNLKLARKTAVKKNKKVEVLWRGYRSFVEPGDPDFSLKELRHRLLVALREIRKIHDIKSLPTKEEKVIIKALFYFLPILLVGKIVILQAFDILLKKHEASSSPSAPPSVKRKIGRNKNKGEEEQDDDKEDEEEDEVRFYYTPSIM